MLRKFAVLVLLVCCASALFAVTTVSATITSPTPGATLTSQTVTFEWTTGSNIAAYRLKIGSAYLGYDVFNGTKTTALSQTVSTLPNDGRTLYVTLLSLPKTSTTWRKTTFTYTAMRSTPPPPPPPPQTSACSGMNIGQGASFNGFVPFPTTSAWRKDISTAAVDPNSASIISYIGGSAYVHPDFGSGLWNGNKIGIPYVVVDAQPKVNVNLSTYAAESDPGPMPIPTNAPIEGYPNPGDNKVEVVDAKNCWVYELGNASVNGDGSWNATVAAVWDLQNENRRPYTWTSSDAAGLPVLPGLVRYDEVAAGHIDHAIRFTLARSRRAFVAPATHWAANTTDALAAPMGMRMRLKASFDVSKFSATNQVILNAMKKYGIIMADNGSNMYLAGSPDERWDNSDLHQLQNVTASNFEVVAMGTVYTDTNVPTGAAPAISALTASSTTVAVGSPVTLTWSATGASYYMVSPQAGPVRGTSITVNPSKTTTYTLYATNQYGRTTKTVTVTVQ